MGKFTGWLARCGVLMSENGKGPWGSGGSGGGDSGGDGGPRNPWQFPPQGRRGGRGSVSSLDEFLKRARGGGGGPGSSGGGGGGFQAPGSPRLWLIGVGVIVALWLILTSFHSIGPEQKGVVTMFGRYTGTLSSGVRFTLPAPINSVEKVNVQKIREENFPPGNGQNLMLTGDQNIVDLTYQARWRVLNPQNYLFEIANPRETVRAVAESAMREIVAEVTLDEAIGAGRSDIEARVQQRMQQLLNSYNAGISVNGVAIRNANPPAAVEDAFKAVTAAQQKAQANLNQARAYAQQVLAAAQGDAAEFDKIYAQYQKAPEVTRRRLYYETMEKVLAKTDKTIVEPDGVTPYLPLDKSGRKLREPETVTSQSQGGQ